MVNERTMEVDRLMVGLVSWLLTLSLRVSPLFAWTKVPGKVPPARLTARLKPSGARLVLTMGICTTTSAERTLLRSAVRDTNKNVCLRTMAVNNRGVVGGVG
jgi:hypothetical protein